MKRFSHAVLTAIALVLCLYASATFRSSPARAAVDGADPAANALLAKHRDFVGWDVSDSTVTSWIATTVRTPERVAPTPTPAPGVTPDPSATPRGQSAAREYRVGLIYRDVYGGGNEGANASSGFTGQRFWNANENGFSVRVVNDEARRLYSDNLVSAEATTLIPGARVHGQAEVAGVKTTIVRLTPANGAPIDAYIAEDGSYRRIVIDPESKFHAIDFTIPNYVEIAPGKKAIGSTLFAKRSRPQTIAYAKVNVPIPATLLQIPSPTATWTFDPAQAALPMTIQRGSTYNNGVGAVVVNATIDGHPGHFLLDSGAGGSIVFKPFADQLTVAPLAESGYSGVNGGFVRSQKIRVKAIAFGANVLHNLIVDRSDAKAFGEIDGILGFDVLARAIVDVDLTNATVRFLDPVKVEPQVGKGAYAFPIDLGDFHITVPVQIGSNLTIHPYIDTGASFDVLISDDLRSSGKVVALTNQIAVGAYRVDDVEYFGGVDGTNVIPVPCVRLTSMKVGPYAYTGVHTCFASSYVFSEDGGLIGFDFLKHFNWTFDYPDEKLVLTPNGK